MDLPKKAGNNEKLTLPKLRFQLFLSQQPTI
ncbi:hypothetical protein CCACVL1_02833 [Corchorus capsularis]|uniref:Uncharacterized protein n=1 Tax=Corchorus capsularis TaxID=210143 RepID=A0A1R3K5F7_COCAP|nr:hypothetical protein CCACVL1_02833 [Corchorus capsularis]